MALTYSTFLSSLALEMVVPSTDSNFLAVLPNIIDDAEQRIYRELDLIGTYVADSSASLSTGTRDFTLPSTNGTFVVVERINVITPLGSALNSGKRNALVPASKEMLDFLYPSLAGSTVPTYFARINNGAIILGPWPDQAYGAEVTGTIRPTPLSASNTTTILSTYFPDLFLAASMVFAAGYQKNFGAAVDDPKMAITWEGHYQSLKASADVEEARKKFTGAGWSSKQPAQLATPPRT